MNKVGQPTIILSSAKPLRVALVRLLSILVMLALVFQLTPNGAVVAKTPQGVDPIRGRWDFLVSDLSSEPLLFNVYINDWQPDPDGEPGTEYLAAGCMRSPDSGAMAPAALHAMEVGGGIYELNLLSTVVPETDVPFTIRFLGLVETNTSAVKDDIATGEFLTSFINDGQWTATHHDRRRTKCPAVVDIPDLDFEANMTVHRAFQGDTISARLTNLGGRTNIVSFGMRVESPDGTTIDAPYFTDVWTPDVDFVTVFQYLTSFPGEPIAGEPYLFTLLDVLGNPIAGTTRTDVWTECLQGPPRNYAATLTSDLDIDLSWDTVFPVPGFDPANDIGFYQLAAPSDNGTDSFFGASNISVANHIIPWASFGGSAPGYPDGDNIGQALSEFEDGNYVIVVWAESMVAPGNPGVGLECATVDLDAQLYFTKAGDSIEFYTPTQ
jgi:hypothetical protein